MKSILTFFTALLLAPLAALHASELRFGAVFSDHMVLQRDKPMPVWGLADRSEQITVEFAGQKETTIAGMDGKWLVKLNPMAASAEPRTLWVRSGQQDRKVQVADVLVGDVWLAAGQSNMAMSVAKSGESAIATREPLPSGIRFFGAGTWRRITTAEVPKQSAVAWAFAREIAQAQKIPMGIIVTAKGGTRIEAWMPRSALMRTEAGRSFAALADRPEVIAAAAEDARAFVPYPQTKLYTWRMGRALPATLHAEFIAPPRCLFPARSALVSGRVKCQPHGGRDGLCGAIAASGAVLARPVGAANSARHCRPAPALRTTRCRRRHPALDSTSRIAATGREDSRRYHFGGCL